MINKAIEFAKEAHEGQVRKYTGDPYVTHPMAVAGIVSTATDDEDMICAAILHDTVEDTDVTIEEIETEFGMAVASLVEMLTDTSKPEDGNRKVRKAIDREHTAKASPDGKTIKLADLIHNSESIVQYDPHFAKIYMKEKQKLLEVLTEGDTRLFEIAQRLVIDYYIGRLENK